MDLYKNCVLGVARLAMNEAVMDLSEDSVLVVESEIVRVFDRDLRTVRIPVVTALVVKYPVMDLV